MPITNESIVIPVPPEEVFDYLNLRLDHRGDQNDRATRQALKSVEGKIDFTGTYTPAPEPGGRG